MSGYWSFREPATALSGQAATSGIQDSMSVQALPYAREISMEMQSAALAEYPWAHSRPAAGADYADNECAQIYDAADPIQDYRRVLALPREDGATARDDDGDLVITPWKFAAGEASPFSDETPGRRESYTEEDVTLIEMDADEEEDVNTSGQETTAGVRTATTTATAARRLPFDTHCVRDLALDETQNTWWRNTVMDEADESTQNLPSVISPTLAARAAEPLASESTENAATATTRTDVEGEGALPDTTKWNDAASLVDEDDRTTLTQMLAPHRIARGPSASKRTPAVSSPSRTRKATASTRQIPAQGDGVAVVGRSQTLAPRSQPASHHRDPLTPHSHPHASTHHSDTAGVTFVERMAQRAAERQRARDELKRQHEEREEALRAQKKEKRQQVQERHKSVDGRPAFSLYGMRCTVAPAASQRSARAPPSSSAPGRVSKKAESARSGEGRAVRGWDSSRTVGRPTSSKPPCRARVIPLDDRHDAAITAPPGTTSTTGNKVSPRRVRFVDVEDTRHECDDPTTPQEAHLPEHMPKRGAESVEPRQSATTTPIPFGEVAALMLEERCLAGMQGDIPAITAIEAELGLLASDYHALRLTKTALRRWRSRGIIRLHRHRLRTTNLESLSRAALPPLPNTNAATSSFAADVTNTASFTHESFPSSPLVAALHEIAEAESTHRQSLIACEANAFVCMTQRMRRLGTALHTLTARTREQELETLRWCFVSWVALEEEHRTARIARDYRERLMACARQTLASLGTTSTY